MSLATGASITLKKGCGYRPIHTAAAMSGMKVASSRRLMSGILALASEISPKSTRWTIQSM